MFTHQAIVNHKYPPFLFPSLPFFKKIVPPSLPPSLSSFIKKAQAGLNKEDTRVSKTEPGSGPAGGLREGKGREWYHTRADGQAKCRDIKIMGTRILPVGKVMEAWKGRG